VLGRQALRREGGRQWLRSEAVSPGDGDVVFPAPKKPQELSSNLETTRVADIILSL
jgi:hypothetical protein